MLKRIALLLTIAVMVGPGHGEAFEGKVTIGLVPEINLVKQMHRYAPVCKYLEKKTGVKVEVRPVGTYGRIFEKIRNGELDGGFFGSFIYVLSHARLGVEPVARPVLPNGISTYSGVTFVRKDSGIRNPSQMKGKTIALVDPATTAGYLAQKDYLLSHGINIDRDMKIIWKGSHDEVMTAVMQREADIGGAKNNSINKLLHDNKTFAEATMVLDDRPHPPVPENTLAFRKGIDKTTVEKLKKTLLNMHNDPEGRQILAKFGAMRFIDTRDSDFKPLYNLVRHLRIDLNTYAYQKK